MKLSTIVLAGALAASSVAPALAAQSAVTGNKLLEQCDADNFPSRGYCLGYVVGVLDTLPPCHFNHTAGVTQQQVMDIAARYLRAHPENRHLSAAVLVFRAFDEFFPCQTN